MFKLISKDAWRVIEETIKFQRAALEKSQERIDRLVEAVSRKNDVPLFMPPPPLPQFDAQPVESSAGWFDTRPDPIPSGGNHK